MAKFFSKFQFELVAFFQSTVVDTPRNDRSFRIEAHASENGMNDHARGDQASEIAGSEKEMTDSLRQRQDYNDAP